MKKTLIALAVLGAAAGVAHAQSNVTVYGVVDTGFVKETQNSWRMDENTNNRIGFRGQEDLGNGLKATFELEKRFYLNNGAAKGAKDARGANGETLDWDGAANVGLAGNAWGRVRFGRMNELPTEYYRKLDPFNQDGVGAGIYSSLRSARISDTVRYDSPSWSGFSFGASYSLGKNDGTYTGYTSAQKDQLNDGYAVSLNYANGPILATANYSRLADSNDSYNWNIGGGYTFAGVARVTLGYEYTKDKRTPTMPSYLKPNAGGGWTPYPSTDAWQMLGGTKQNNWLLGLQWALGPGKLNASYNYSKIKDGGDGVSVFDMLGGNTKDTKLHKYAIGYTYDLSKRTAIYGNIAYTKYDNGIAGLALYGLRDGKDNNTAYQVGMTHKF